MSQFDPETINVMRSVLEEVCSHIPAHAAPARTFVAARILECASSGKQSHDLLMEAGRRAVIDQYGSMDAVLSAFARTHPPELKLRNESWRSVWNTELTSSVKTALYQGS